MNSIRTKLSVLDTKMFKLFLEANDMKDVIVGNYDDRVNNYQIDNRICYAYSNSSVEAIASMTYMSLKYGSVELAFNDFKKCIMSSNVNDPHFNWIP
jgi:hypothetical protein